MGCFGGRRSKADGLCRPRFVRNVYCNSIHITNNKLYIMKKALSIVLLLCGLAAAQAQNPVSITLGGATYQAGDTITIQVNKNAFSTLDIIGIAAVAVIEDAEIILTPIQENGFRVSGLCTTRCVEGLVSAPFDIPALPDYFDGLSFDLSWEATADNSSSCSYTMEVAEQPFVVRFVVRSSTGIDSSLPAASLSAYPNPAAGAATISYSVDRPSVLVVVDALGRTVRRASVNGNGSLRIEGLSAGLYAFGISTDGSRPLMQKLVVE